ncbi:hypothetical protein M885DRAFT_165759 [Pelagophyceae sp. CCMP2097]|nr:hypothetical protein M885DRAFT_165759 [Pelagophyceae sp. CCMP2097]
MWVRVVLAALAAAGCHGGHIDVVKMATDFSMTNKGRKVPILSVPAETVVAYSLDGGGGLETTALSTIASLSSVVHNAPNVSSLRFVYLMIVPEEVQEKLAAAICATITSAVGARLKSGGGALPMCASRAFDKTALNSTSCAVADAELPARVTFIFFPSLEQLFPDRIANLLELLCCSQRRYQTDRQELARSLGNHARFFAHLALLHLGTRRVLFLDADTLTRTDVTKLYEAPLTARGFVGAARRCASKRAAYKPRFKFDDAVVQEFGLKSEAFHINAGVLLVDLEQYCLASVVEALERILERHVAGPQLWHQGNNQPPFTIAVAAHLTFLHPSWNVRPGDADAESRIVARHKEGSMAEDLCAQMVAAPPLIIHTHEPAPASPGRPPVLSRWWAPSRGRARSAGRVRSRDSQRLAAATAALGTSLPAGPCRRGSAAASLWPSSTLQCPAPSSMK